jgi:hypothetical protein
MSGLLTYSLEFRGEASRNGDELVLHATAPSCTHETRLENEGLVARLRFGDWTEEAFLESHLVLDDDGTFFAIAAIDFGHGHRLRGRTMDRGRLARSADEYLQHGSATIHVLGGSGQFEGASGQITSNFVVSDTGEVTDNHLGMLFLRPA